MKRSDFHYHLPEHLIAQQPLARREDSRLLCVDRTTGALVDRRFHELPGLLQPGDLLVFNDTRVIPARLYARKDTGGAVEILIERVLDDRRLLAQMRASKSPRPGTHLILGGGDMLRVEGRQDEFFLLELEGEGSVLPLLEREGHIPLPPYIRREDVESDVERYQTVYARHAGAVAAPTAGLHFSEDLLARCREAGVETGFVTLHVGAGTFQPVRADDITDHVMHSECYAVGEVLCDQVARTRAAGGRVIAVGTTVVRTLESALRDGRLQAGAGETDIFITPGYAFQVIDGLITNFHLPESTLLMLVSAFAGMETTREAYAHAVNEEYRFFSYGDAMLVI